MKNQLQNSDCGRTRRANPGLKETRDMGGKVLLLTLVVLTFLLVGTGFAFENEPDGFRGLKWGDPPTNEMIYHRNLLGVGETKVFTRPNDEMYIGNIQFDLIAYLYDKSERFTMAVLLFSEEKKFDLLKNACRERFGIETKKEPHQLTWRGLKTAVVLAYDISKRQGELSFVGLEIWAKLKSEQQGEIKKVMLTMTLDQAKILVEMYNKDPAPLPLKKFGEAFLILAESQEKEEKYMEALWNYITANKIFKDIHDRLEGQKRWNYKEEKTLEYYEYYLAILHKVGFCMFKIPCMQLRMGLRTQARDNFIIFVLNYGADETDPRVQESLKILKREFGIDKEDLRAFGLK